ncbi:MAG: sugar transferase, partial [Candidatus Marinimicrobia bacterium]|nr:sugar transferase [Candidatus Neomarinimicrobiota bacterium]
NNSKTNGFSNGHSEQRFIPFDTSQFVQSFIFFSSDVLFIVGAFLAVYYWQIVPNLLPEQLLTPYNLVLWIAWSVIYWTSLLGLNNLYRIEWDTSRVDEIFTVFKIIFFGTIVLFFLSFEFKIPFLPSRRILVTYGILLVIGISVGRLALITILKKYNLLEFKKRPTLIIGASRRALNVVRKINSVPELKFNIVGMVDDHANGNIGKIMEGVPIIGSFEDMPEIIKKRKIKEVIIALDDNNMNQVIDMIDLFSKYNVSIKLLPDFYNLLTGFRTSHIYGVSLVKFFGSNMKTWEWVLKRLIDIIISLVVLIGFLPIWLIISLIIKLDSPGPVFYKQKRIGKNRREFEVIKFRSMVQGAEQETGPKWAEKNDPRVTRFGKFLRKTGLDEIPQFFNVLVGDMSIVGPRPERDYFVNELERSIQFYSRRLIIKPGITGWAQIKYKYDETIDDVREKLRYDLYYIENMSVILDLKIIIQTLLIGLRRKHRTSYV